MQRQIILDSVKELGNHPTAEQVYFYVSKKHPTISKATVYRNLAQAASSGEVSTVGVINGSMRFDHNTSDHFHFVCQRCYGLVDVPHFGLPDQYPFNELNIKKVELTLHGICDQCR